MPLIIEIILRTWGKYNDTAYVSSNKKAVVEKYLPSFMFSSLINKATLKKSLIISFLPGLKLNGAYKIKLIKYIIFPIVIMMSLLPGKASRLIIISGVSCKRLK